VDTPARPIAASDSRPTLLSVYLPFNRDTLGRAFQPAKEAAKPPERRHGYWLLVHEQSLVVAREGDRFRLPQGDPPPGLEDRRDEALWLGTLDSTPCWVLGIPRGAALPGNLTAETLVPMRGTRLPDDLLSLGGIAMQALHWESTSGHCPRCGEGTERIEGEWGKRCRKCRYEHYPHLHPAVIILIRDGARCLLARKREWAPGRYALVAGFVDNGESLEGAVHREVKEEVGVDVKDLRYVGSQNWPFPSQLMIGFVATYAGGEVRIDPSELEDARWFASDRLPEGPSRHSIARFILDHYAQG
jgi:NAD+ diphosphatase